MERKDVVKVILNQKDKFVEFISWRDCCPPSGFYFPEVCNELMLLGVDLSLFSSNEVVEIFNEVGMNGENNGKNDSILVIDVCEKKEESMHDIRVDEDTQDSDQKEENQNRTKSFSLEFFSLLKSTRFKKEIEKCVDAVISNPWKEKVFKTIDGVETIVGGIPSEIPKTKLNLWMFIGKNIQNLNDILEDLWCLEFFLFLNWENSFY